jgi:hypothetical protein
MLISNFLFISILKFKFNLLFLSQLIKNLESEKEELNKNLKLAQSKTNEIKDENKIGHLESLLSNKGITFN